MYVCLCTHMGIPGVHVCAYAYGSLSLQTPKVAKIQVAWLIKDPLEVPLTPSTKVAHVLRQFTEHLSPGSQGQEASKDKDSLLPR